MKKNLLALSLLTTSLLSSQVMADPIVVFKDALNKKQVLSASSLPQAVSNVIKEFETKQPDLYKIVVYRFDEYYVLHLLSGKYWQVAKVRVDIDTAGKVTIIEPYMGSHKENTTLLSQDDEPVCPNDKIEVVAISAYPGVGDVDKSLDAVYQMASTKYKSIKILDANADGQTYKNWLSCPNLKGFYTIGHGNNEGIMVGKGDFISYEFFKDEKFNRKYQKTTLVFNSCDVFNAPLGPQLVFGNNSQRIGYLMKPGPKAYEYVGGYIGLLIGSSEDISACFMSKAMTGVKMDYNLLKNCVGLYNFHYQDFALSDPGKQFGF